MDAMGVVVTSDDRAEGRRKVAATERHPGDTQIGVDVIRGKPEICIMAIGLGRLIGRCVGRGKRGRFVSLTKRLVVGAYTGSAMEFERRPSPRKALVVAAQLVLGLTLAVLTAPAPQVAAAAAIGAMILPMAVNAVRWFAGYLDREFSQQWRLALALLPVGASLVWLVTR